MVADVVDGIERRKAMIVCPRRNSIVARTPGLFRPIVDRIGFPGRTIPDAIRLASPH